MEVAINLQGGLGNVLFQVAFGLSVARRYGCGVFIGTMALQHMTTRGYEYFLRGMRRKTPEALVGAAEWTPGDVSLEKPFGEAFAATEARLAQAAERGERLRIVNGFFQSPAWWGAGGAGGAGDWEAIRAQFAMPAEVRAALLGRLGGNSARSYFIHVRRGDYVGSPFDMALERGYFARALAAAPWRDDAVGVLFTDDPGYTPEVFAARTGWAAERGRIVAAPRDLDECCTLWLMSLCRLGGVCSNSTFSWWGGFLNEAADKWIAFPREWHSERLAFSGLVAIAAGAP